MRDQVVWMCGLRGEKPKNLHDIGLKEFYLHHNKLGDECMSALSKVIKYDEYLRVLDLRNNKITEKSLKQDLMPVLKNNFSLTNIDLRRNPGLTIKMQKLIALNLLKNLDKLKKSNVDVKK